MYEKKCPRCDGFTIDINNYYCIKNTGTCERCISFNLMNKQRKNPVLFKEKEVDPFDKYRPKNYKRQTVDNLSNK